MKISQALLAISLALGPGGWACAGPPDPEAQLSAIRQALVDATLDKTTKVNATAWVDEKGQLHESAHFQTDARIKGIKVLSYGSEEEGPAKVKVEMESLPWSVRVAKANPGEACEPAPHQWRQPLLIRSQLMNGFTGPEMYMSNALLKEAQKAWQEVALQTGRWSIDAPPAISKDAYHQAWLGGGEEPLGWQLVVQLMPAATVRDAGNWLNMLSTVFGESTKSWTLRAMFGQKSSISSPLSVYWTKDMKLDVPLESISKQPDRWIRQVMPDISRIFAQWLQPEGADASCDPVKFSVSVLNGSKWVIQAGLESGIKVGDRVLVINANKLPGRLLEPGASQQMGLAEVTRVGKRQAELKPLAGSIPPVSGDWVALPL
jgi:hypothetical protein